MPLDRNLEIAIVGAGVAGLAAALYLHRSGHRVTLYEQFPAPRPVGSGLLLQPTGLTVLADLGLVEEICTLGQRVERLHGADALSGRTVLDVAYRGGQFGVGIHRAALFEVLFDAVLAAGITIRTGERILRVSSDNGRSKLEGADGAGDNPSFDLVVDASGARSELVDASSPGARRQALAYGAFWATVDWPGVPFRTNALQQRYEAARIMVGVLPVGYQGRMARHQDKPSCALFWSLKSEDVAAVKARGLEAWKADVRRYWPATEVLLDQIASFEDLTFASYGHHTLALPFRDGLVHIGDSAHATSPQLGQGANMALLDAAALAMAVERAQELSEIGPIYAAARRRHIRVFQFMSRALTPFYQSDGRIIPFARDTLVATVARIPPMPQILAALVAGTLVDPFRPIGLAPWRPETNADNP